MAKKLPRPEERSVADLVLDAPEASVLDVLDHILNKGIMATGDVTLGVAGIDLIYLRLSALLCAADHVLPDRSPAERAAMPRRTRRRMRKTR